MLTLLQPAVMQSKTKTQPPRLQAKKNCSKTCVDNVDYYDRMDRPLSQAQPRRRGADPTATRSLETMNLGLTLIGVLGIGVGAFFKLNMLHSEWAFPLLVSGALLAGVGVLGRMLAQLCPEAYTAATPQKVVASSF